jgi:predicted ATPase
MLSVMIRTVAIEGYRSLRDLKLPIAQLTVITAANEAANPASIARSACSPMLP